MPKSGPGAVIVDGIRLLVMDVMVSQVGEFSSNLGGMGMDNVSAH
jgi:hypothetical protein